MQRFEAAPWPVSLRVVSTIGTVLLVGVGYALVRVIPRGTRAPFAEEFGTLMVAAPVAILLVALLFVVRGYEVNGATLHVERLLWRTPVALAGLARAWHDPSAMKRSLRIFGNGGLYSITGVFTNPALGRYRAFVTDPGRAVVLAFESRVVVVSPAYPHALLGHLASVCPGVAVGEPPSAG